MTDRKTVAITFNLEVPMAKLNFTANYNIDGKPQTQAMEYDTGDVVKTLERRLKTAFPNATGIVIVENSTTPRGGR